MITGGDWTEATKGDPFAHQRIYQIVGRGRTSFTFIVEVGDVGGKVYKIFRIDRRPS